MPQSSPQPSASSVPAHPLALRLISRLRAHGPISVVELGSGCGRNTAALLDAGFTVVVVPDAGCRAPLAAAGGSADAALSTHGLLHGLPRDLAELRAEIARIVKPGGVVYGTLASHEDARFGRGVQVDDMTYAAEDGPEAGVPHPFFDERRMRALFKEGFAIEEASVVDVDAIVGRWAHGEGESPGRRHWFVIATRV